MLGRFRNSLATALVLSCLLAILPQLGGAVEAGPPGCGQAVVNIQTDDNCEVSGFECSKEDDRGQPAIRFRFDLMNTSGKPQEYRVEITTSSGHTVGGLVPRPEQEKKRVIIGGTVPVSFAIVGISQPPGTINVTVASVLHFGDEK